MRNFISAMLALPRTLAGTNSTKPKMPGSDGSALVTIDQLVAGATVHHVVMKAEKEQALVFRCPTCGAKPGEKCELNTGLPRTEPHPARRVAAEKE